MPMFQCTGCGCAENTACCNFWSKKIDKVDLLCSACDPTIGKWHGRFPQRPAEGMLLDSAGYLWNRGSESGLPNHLKIVGVIPPFEKKTE